MSFVYTRLIDLLSIRTSRWFVIKLISNIVAHLWLEALEKIQTPLFLEIAQDRLCQQGSPPWFPMVWEQYRGAANFESQFVLCDIDRQQRWDFLGGTQQTYIFTNGVGISSVSNESMVFSPSLNCCSNIESIPSCPVGPILYSLSFNARDVAWYNLLHGSSNDRFSCTPPPAQDNSNRTRIDSWQKKRMLYFLLINNQAQRKRAWVSSICYSRSCWRRMSYLVAHIRIVYERRLIAHIRIVCERRMDIIQVLLSFCCPWRIVKPSTLTLLTAKSETPTQHFRLDTGDLI